MVKHHLAIDIGAGSGRVIVGTITDGTIAMDEIHRFPTQCAFLCGNLVTNIYHIYEEIIKALGIYVRKYGNELASLGVDTWGTDFGIIDKNGKLISLPIFYRDGGVDGTEKVVEAKIGYRRLYELTSHRRANSSTLHRLIYLLQNKDTAITCGDKLLFLGDLIHYFLTGKPVSEYTAASYSQMYNTKEQTWENAVFDAFGIPRHLQPKVVFPGDTIGCVHEEITRPLGLGEVKVVAPGVHDTASAVAAVPSQGGSNWAFISSGTWSLVGMELDQPIINEASFENDISQTGLAFGKVLFKKNIMGLWILQRCKREWEREGVVLTYDQITEMAEHAEPFVGYIDPDDGVYFNPENMLETVCANLRESQGLDIDVRNVGQIARIVLESLAMKYKHALDILVEVSGKAVDRLHIIGGGSANRLLNRFTAAGTGLEVLAGPKEATALGNVMIQAYGCGEIASLEEIRDTIRQVFPPEVFRPHDGDQWRKEYQRFLRVLNLNG